MSKYTIHKDTINRDSSAVTEAAHPGTEGQNRGRYFTLK